jgi:hypothetical protein
MKTCKVTQLLPVVVIGVAGAADIPRYPPEPLKWLSAKIDTKSGNSRTKGCDQSA